MPYDPKCYELAVHVLNPKASRTMKEDLAQWIEDQIWFWIYDDRDGAIEAAYRLGELPDQAA